MVSADNPASNLMGGYKNLSSAFRKCRHCLATKEELQTVVCTQVLSYVQYYGLLELIARVIKNTNKAQRNTTPVAINSKYNSTQT